MSENARIEHGAVDATRTESAVAELSRARKDLLAELCGLGATMSAAMEALPGFVPCGHAFGIVIEGLFGSVACDDVPALRQLAAEVHARSEHVSDHRGVAMGPVSAPDTAKTESAVLLAALAGIGARAYHAMQAGVMSDEVDVFLAQALAALGAGSVSHDLLMRAAKVAVEAEQLV